jgi:hypothetical protein
VFLILCLQILEVLERVPSWAGHFGLNDDLGPSAARTHRGGPTNCLRIKIKLRSSYALHLSLARSASWTP